MKSLIKDWYKKSFPSDELGNEIKADVTFQDVYDALENYQDLYSTIEVADSIVRERIFTELAKKTGMSYDEIYEQWLYGAEIRDREGK